MPTKESMKKASTGLVNFKSQLDAMHIYKFRCEYGHITKKKRKQPYRNDIRIRCKECGLYAYRSAVIEKKEKEKLRRRQHERRLIKSGWLDDLEIL